MCFPNKAQSYEVLDNLFENEIYPIVYAHIDGKVMLVARPPVGEVTAHPPPGSPRSPGAARYSVVEKKKLPLIYHQKNGANGDGNHGFFLKYFFICAMPLRTERRTALLSTPSALAISR